MLVTIRVNGVQKNISLEKAPRDVNGNSRYLIDHEQLGLAVCASSKTTRAAGLKKYDTKKHPGTFVFQGGGNLEDTLTFIFETLEKKEVTYLKTSSRPVIERIQTSMLEWLDEGLTWTDVDKEFKNWCSPYELKKWGSYQEAFHQFMMCLPCFHTPYAHWEIDETLDKWLEGVKPPSKVQDSAEKQRFMNALVYREFLKLLKAEQEAKGAN